MKKTLRLMALAGILAPALLITERPSHAMRSCSEKHGLSCSSTPHNLCFDDEYSYTILTCECVDSVWDCYPQW
jgi:hypothetical protein